MEGNMAHAAMPENLAVTEIESERHSSTIPEASDEKVLQLQQKLAFRFALIFLIPIFVVVPLGLYSYHLSLRVNDLEALEEVNAIETFVRLSNNIPQAIDRYEKLMKSKKYYTPQVFTRLGGLYFARGQSGDEANGIRMLNGAIELDKNYAEAYSTLTYIYYKTGNLDQAVAIGERALGLDHFDSQTYNNLAWIYATSKDEHIKDLKKAKEYAVTAVELTRETKPAYLDTLAETYFGMGNVQSAIITIKKAIQVDEGKNQYYLRQLERFQKGDMKGGK
jgi:tetratricopeptide (TPR) repeat protein